MIPLAGDHAAIQTLSLLFKFNKIEKSYTISLSKYGDMEAGLKGGFMGLGCLYFKF